MFTAEDGICAQHDPSRDRQPLTVLHSVGNAAQARPINEVGDIVRAHRLGIALLAAGIVGCAQEHTPDDLDIARAAVIVADDLPTGWTQCCGASAYQPSELDEHICGSSDDLPPHTAGFDREFTLNLTAEGLEDGHLVHAVFLAPSEEAAAREFEAVDSPAYGPCAEESVARSAEIAVPNAVRLIDVSRDRAALPSGVQGIVDRFKTRFETTAGSDVVFTTFVRMQEGRAIVRMPIMTYDAPLSDADLKPFIDEASDALHRALASELKS